MFHVIKVKKNIISKEKETNSHLVRVLRKKYIHVGYVWHGIHMPGIFVI